MYSMKKTGPMMKQMMTFWTDSKDPWFKLINFIMKGEELKIQLWIEIEG